MAKVAILHEYVGRSKGGIEAWIYHTSEELTRLGHSVTIIHTMGDQVPDDGAPDDVDLFSLNRKRIKPSIIFIRSTLSYKKQLSKILSGYDFIWARSFRMAWAASEIVGKNKVVYINAAPYSYYAYRPFYSLLKKARSPRDVASAVFAQMSYITAFYFEKEAIKNSINVYLSNERKNQTLSFFNLKDDSYKFKVVPAGVDYERFAPFENKNFNSQDLRIISVARLEKRKNIQCVINALKILIKEGFNVKYTVVGDGEFKDELVNLVEDNGLGDYISFEGKQLNVEKWYQKSDILVLPSLYEGFGNIYIEAMSSGLPCIAISNQSGEYSVASDEIIDHGKNGFLMEENSPVLLADLIKEFINNRNLLIEFGNEAREKVLEKFTWHKTVNSIINI